MAQIFAVYACDIAVFKSISSKIFPAVPTAAEHFTVPVYSGAVPQRIAYVAHIIFISVFQKIISSNRIPARFFFYKNLVADWRIIGIP